MLPPVIAVTLLLMTGFGFAFFIMLGPYLSEYKTFEDTMYTMMLVVFEDFDVIGIMDYSGFTFRLGSTAISIPVGLLIFCVFAILTVFIMLMMLLTLVDNGECWMWGVVCGVWCVVCEVTKLIPTGPSTLTTRQPTMRYSKRLKITPTRSRKIYRMP